MSNATAAAPPSLPPLDNTLGAMYIGVVLSALLFGISCLQTYHYYDRFREDPWYFKALVGAVFISDSMNQALISHTVYYYLISHFDQPKALVNLVWSLVVEVLFQGITALLVQSFFAFRIWRLSQRNIWITLLVIASVIGNFCVLCTYTAGAFGLSTLLELPKIKALSLAINYMAAITDVLIAAAMCILLHRAKSGFKKSDSTVNKIIVFVINTGLLTSVCALASLVSTLAWPDAYIYICFFFMIGRLYSNSLLAALNARAGGAFGGSFNHPTTGGARSEDAGAGGSSFAELTRGGRTLPLAQISHKGPYPHPSRQEIQVTIDKELAYDDSEMAPSADDSSYGDKRTDFV